MALLRPMHPGIFPGFGLFIQILILILVIAIIWWVLKSSNGGSALDILNKRYAKGEIKRKEYLKLKKDIEK